LQKRTFADLEALRTTPREALNRVISGTNFGQTQRRLRGLRPLSRKMLLVLRYDLFDCHREPTDQPGHLLQAGGVVVLDSSRELT
jgi:hypothetical protein